MFYNGFTLYIIPNLYNIFSPNTIMHLVFSAVLLGLQPHTEWYLPPDQRIWTFLMTLCWQTILMRHKRNSSTACTMLPGMATISWLHESTKMNCVTRCSAKQKTWKIPQTMEICWYRYLFLFHAESTLASNPCISTRLFHPLQSGSGG